MPFSFFNHHLIDGANLHGIIWRTWASAAARTSDTYVLTDVGKVGRQTDNNSLWCLINHSPATFIRMDAQTTNAAGIAFTPGGSLAATNVQDALAELDSEKQPVGTYIKADGSVNMAASLNLNSHKITNLTDPTADQDAATKAYVDANAGGGVAENVDFTPAGNIAATDVQAAIEELDSEKLAVSSSAYIKTNGTQAFSGNQSLGGNKITNSAEPTSAADLATKGYVDARAAGLRDQKDSVLAATTGNITLSGPQTIDGVSCGLGARVFVKDQTNAEENGIYIVAAGAWSRATDFDETAEVTAGAWIWVENGGATNGNTAWFLTTADPITVGTDDLNFQQFADAGAVAAGDGMTKSGNTLNVVAADSTITVNANSIQLGAVGLSNIANNLITVAKLEQIAKGRFLSRKTSGTGNVEILTPTEATAELDAFTGDSGAGGVKGLVPAPASGDTAANKYLNASGAWSTVNAASLDGVAPSAFVKTLLDDADAKTFLRTLGVAAPHSKFTAPDALSNWTKRNQSTSSMTDETGPDGGNTLLIRETGRASFNWRSILKAVPGSTPYTITMCIRTFMLYGARLGVGLCLTDSATSGKLVILSSDQDAINLWKWSTDTGYDSHFMQYNGSRGRDIWWMRMYDNGTNRQFYLSPDGLIWIPFGAAHSRTSYLTATHYGFVLDAGVASDTEGISQLVSVTVT